MNYYYNQYYFHRLPLGRAEDEGDGEDWIGLPGGDNDNDYHNIIMLIIIS